jgi:hypothetical protein
MPTPTPMVVESLRPRFGDSVADGGGDAGVEGVAIVSEGVDGVDCGEINGVGMEADGRA